MPRLKAIPVLSLATLLAPAALAQYTISARPGTINYVEGSATVNGQPLNPQSAATTSAKPGQTIATTDGRVEMLLTPGVYLRLDQGSAVRLISPDLTRTEVQVDRGRAEVEVDQLYKQNDIRINVGNVQTRLLGNGLYEFDTTANLLRVFDGKAAVTSSASDSGKPVEVKSGHTFALGSGSDKTAKFDRKHYDDALVSWSDLRTEYLSGGPVNAAHQQTGYGGYGDSFGPGWYNSFAYGGGYPFYSGFSGFGPFGYGPGLGLYSGLGYGYGGLGYGFGGLGAFGYGGYPGFYGGYPGGYGGGYGYRGGTALHNGTFVHPTNGNRPVGGMRSAGGYSHASGAGGYAHASGASGGGLHGAPGGMSGGGGFHGGGGGSAGGGSAGGGGHAGGGGGGHR